MYSNNLFVRFIRIILFPFSLIYGFIIIIRNYLFDKNILRSATFEIPIICVGNLSVGGTGKSPMVELLVALLKKNYSVATLSRGYSRKTKGYKEVTVLSTPEEVGDEPLQFKIKFSDITVAVAEQRIEGIPRLIYENPNIEVIILDDAFQHRTVKPGFNILLTEFNSLYAQDFFLPTGNLRDSKISANRADVIVVTKCPSFLQQKDKMKLQKLLNVKPYQHLFIATLQYDKPKHLFTNEEIALENKHILLFTAIANDKVLIDYLKDHAQSVDVIKYPDHHHFNEKDVQDLVSKYSTISTGEKIIITTSKDAVKLNIFNNQLNKLPIYVLNIRHQVLLGEDKDFNSIILNYVETKLSHL